METMDFQSNLAMMEEDTEYEEKVDFDDLVLPAEPTKLVKIDFNDFARTT